MPVGEKDLAFMEEVAAYFKTTIDPDTMPDGSIRETAQHFNLTRTKVQKILVTMGLYSSPQVRDIQRLRAEGLSVKEIAERLALSQATVSASLPYTTVIHGTAEPSEHTQAVRDYRAYEKAQTERMKGKKDEMNEHAHEQTHEQTSEHSESRKELKMNPSRKIGRYTLPANLIRLHVSLEYDGDEKDIQILQQYGGVKRGKTITRDIIVLKKMPLRSLHFTLQRAFGFTESHLHRFEISHDDIRRLTEDKTENLLNLAGVIFTKTRIDGYDPFEPEYHGGSFKNWLKKQYTAPYEYIGDWLEEFHLADNNEEEFLEEHLLYKGSPDNVYYKLTPLHPETWNGNEYFFLSRSVLAEKIDDLPGKGQYVKWTKDNEYPFKLTLERCDADDPDAQEMKKIRLGDMKIDEGLATDDEIPSQIIERLKIGDVLALAGDYLPYDDEGNKIHTVTGLKHPQIVTRDDIQVALTKGKEILTNPFTDMLNYIYDYGDHWSFYITGSKGCSD